VAREEDLDKEDLERDSRVTGIRGIPTWQGGGSYPKNVPNGGGKGNYGNKGVNGGKKS
jgi:hypothetical protein